MSQRHLEATAATFAKTDRLRRSATRIIQETESNPARPERRHIMDRLAATLLTHPFQVVPAEAA